MTWKIGRCTQCFRLSFTGAVILLALAIVASGVGASPWLQTVAWAVFALLATLWLAHVLTFSHRSVRELRELRKLRGAPLDSATALRHYLRRLHKALLVSIPLPFLALWREGCNCYFDDECFLWRVCDYSADCFRVRKGTFEVLLGHVLDCPASERASTGSCDGRCAHWRNLAAADADSVAQGMEEYLDLFIAAASRRDGEGSPTRAELRRIQSKWPATTGQELRRATYSLLDALLGWDLVMTDYEPMELFASARDAFLGHIAHEEATPALLRAARSGLGAALRGRDPDAVAPPLVEFWQTYPDYRPEHMGRCYPHGGHSYNEAAVDCHIAHLRRTVAAILQV